MKIAVLTYTRELMIRIHNQTAAPQPSSPVPCPERVFYTKQLQLDYKDSNNHFLPSHGVEAHTNKQQIFGTKCVVSDGETLLPAALRAYLSQRVDAVGLKVQHWAIVSPRKWSADLRVGPAVVIRWSEKGKPIYKTVPWRKGICLSSTFRDQQWFSKRLTLTVFGIIQAPKVNITWNLTFRSIFQITNPAYSACLKGDWELLRTLLKNGKVGISDSTGYGDTLLHVCPLPSIFIRRY